ncbi:MAG: T9SS type A sorting domain-containing protein [Prolixibacteraceae bacterium]|nr:T9SS type A sorting domain-containing protein [Prolixibacteraceae bacterium]
MRKNSSNFFVIILLFFGVTRLSAQADFASAGGNASGNGGSLSYTIGLVNFTMNSGSVGCVSQGVQHAYEIGVIDGITVSAVIELAVFVYPNPAADFLILKHTAMPSNQSGQLSFKLYDMKGQLLKREMIINSETLIEVNHYAPSTYFLTVNKNDEEIKSFKIVKK